jgi:coenzyme Q-binding protein COQ10
MPKHSETRHLPYTPEQMFDLVADVGRYAEFLPWVSAMRVRSNSDTETLADMIVGFKGLRETFTSRVEKVRPSELTVDYVDGPLKYLRNEWHFRPEPQGCAVDFTVDFAFKNMIGAFETRAAELYGADASGNKSSSAHNAA